MQKKDELGRDGYDENHIFVTWLKSGGRSFPICPCSSTLIELKKSLVCFECGARFNKDGTLFGIKQSSSNDSEVM